MKVGFIGLGHMGAAMAGNLPGFEEACRALFADDFEKLLGMMAPWPGDIRDHSIRLATGERAAAA